MRQEIASVDAIVARRAANQHGVLTIDELRSAGMTPDAVKRRVASGRLHRIHRGVYAVGHAGLSVEGRWIAAVKACGEGSVLSHRSAAELWQILPRASEVAHVTVPGDGGRARRGGIQIHRSLSLTKGDTTRRSGIAVSTPARTIADLRRTVDAEVSRMAIRQAEVLGLPLEEAVADSDRSRSELERAFLRLCRRSRIPRPEVNVRVGPFLVDFLWREPRLIVEVDGYGAHRGRQAFEDDRARDVELKLLGFEVVRFTYRQVVSDPAGVAAAVSALLGTDAGKQRGSG